MSKKILYSRDIPVLECELTIKNKNVIVEGESCKVLNEKALPVALTSKNGFVSSNQLEQWIKNRIIPRERIGMGDIMRRYGEKNIYNQNMTFASLMDQYYFLNKRNETRNWHDVNFYENSISTIVGDLFLRPWTITKEDLEKPFVDTPDITTNGVLQKLWVKNKHENNTEPVFFLYKKDFESTDKSSQSQFAILETLACSTIKRLQLMNKDEYVDYSIAILGVSLCSRCKSFMNINMDFVPASNFYHKTERTDDETIAQHLIKRCKEENIPNAEEFIRKMVLVDHTIGNTDRNLSNFGFLRDNRTYEWLGPAPLYDFGSAFHNIKAMMDGTSCSKNFKDLEDEMGLSNKKILLTELANDIKTINSYPLPDGKKERFRELTGIEGRIR